MTDVPLKPFLAWARCTRRGIWTCLPVSRRCDLPRVRPELGDYRVVRVRVTEVERERRP